MANNTLIGAIRAEATLESGKFVDGAKKIRKEAKATEVQVKSSFSAMGTAVKGFGGALTAGLSIGLLGGLAKKALDFATAIKDVAAQTGVSTKALQEFRYAASQVGIKQAEADKGLEKLNLTLGKAAAGSASAQKALAAVGVTMQDVKTKSPTQIFGIMADQINKQGGAAKNTAGLNAVLGESYAKLNPLVAKGSKGLNELAQAANRLGVVLSDSQIQQADETARKLDDVRQVLAAQIAGVVADNAASIVTLAQALGQLTSAVVNFLGSNPQAALAILGGLAGSRFGLPGAAVGAFGGYLAGEHVAAGAADSNMDPAFRARQVREAQARFRKARQFTSRTAPDAQVIATEKELRKQIDLARKATAQARAGKGPTGTAGVPQFLAPAPKKARSGGRTPKGRPRDRSDDVAFQFDQELRRAQVDVLRAQQSIATTSDERARIALELLSAEREMQEAELNDRVRRAERDFAEGKIDAATLEQAKVQADKLRAEYDSRDAIERKAIADDLLADQARDRAALADAGRDIEIEKAQLEASLLETASERRDAELSILNLMKEQERARLQALIADKDSSELAKAEAQLRLDNLDAIYAGRTDSVIQGTRGPMEDWIAQLPTTAAKAQEAFEQLQVQGFEGLIDAAVALTEGFDSAKDALLSTLKQFVQGLLRMQLQGALGSILPKGGFNLGSIFGGASGGGISESGAINVTGLSTDASKVFGFHSGGSLKLGGIPGIDKNVISMNGIPIARADYGERLHFEPANDRVRGSGRAFSQTFNVYANDADSFRKSEGQILRQSRRRLGV